MQFLYIIFSSILSFSLNLQFNKIIQQNQSYNNKHSAKLYISNSYHIIICIQKSQYPGPLMKNNTKELQQNYLNSLIYTQLTPEAPTRHEMIKYSTWRIYLYNEIESVSAHRRDPKKIQEKYSTQFPALAISDERIKFMDFVYKPTDQSNKDYKEDFRNDNISHFICRMLYCQDQTNHQTFIEVERKILESRLRRILRENTHNDRRNLMELMKKMLSFFKGRQPQNYYDIPNEEWNKLKQCIIFSVLFPNKRQQYPSLYAKLPFEQAESGIFGRRSYIHKKFVYVGTEAMIDIVLSNYCQYLRKKLEKTRPVVQDLMVEDLENQFSSFLIGTIKQINEQGMQDTKLNGKFNLTLKNIQALSKFFPPCMLNLNQHLKINRHLRHDGRRQLWGFFKACGMECHDNKQYFRKHLEGKVTASEMKTHMYNIEHAYGFQGKKKAQNAWICRNIITGTAPKKGEHHGCPFYHWRSEELGEFLRKNYKVSEDKLKQILAEKQQKHFQVACGRLFEYADVNNTDGMSIPAQITAKLGKAPYLYYEAGMELRERKLKQNQGAIKQQDKSIQF